MIFTGKTADGSDMYPAMGAFVSPDGEEWSSEPYTKEDKMWQELYSELADRRHSLRMEYDLVLAKKSTLNRRHRDYVIHLMTFDNEQQ